MEMEVDWELAEVRSINKRLSCRSGRYPANHSVRKFEALARTGPLRNAHSSLIFGKSDLGTLLPKPPGGVSSNSR